jgi:mannose-6-phosphate isomerase-like protein (cupin superfamily)
VTLELDPRGAHPAGSQRTGLAPVIPIDTNGVGAIGVPPLRNAPIGIRLDPESLAWLARLYGSSCVTPWTERQECDPTERQYELLELSCDFEVWVIHWPVGGVLQLHDHGGSAGALWVVGGTLEEGTMSNDVERRRQIRSGDGVSFGPEHVHDVVNPGTAVATSVQVYSPPMEQMTFFRVGRSGVVAERTEQRSDPSWAP